MKEVYPVILTPDNKMFLVNVLEMARDAICITAVDMQDENKTLPMPSAISSINAEGDSIVTLVDVDLDAYRLSLIHI